MIKHQSDKYNWQFMFLGANMDAATEAETIGISRNYAATYDASSIGTDALYCTVSKSVADYRNTGAVDATWAENLSADHTKY